MARKGHSSIANTRLIIPGASQRRRLSQKSTRRGNPYAPYGGAAANSSACIGGVGIAKLMSPTATLLAFALLVKGCLEREFFRAPINALWKHILLPAAVLCFVSFLDSGAAAGRQLADARGCGNCLAALCQQRELRGNGALA